MKINCENGIYNNWSMLVSQEFPERLFFPFVYFVCFVVKIFFNSAILIMSIALSN